MKISEIINKDNWIKNSYAIDKDGKAVASHSQRAVQWCAVGFLHKYQIETRSVVLQLPKKYGHSITAFNDDPETTVEMVKELFEKAGV